MFVGATDTVVFVRLGTNVCFNVGRAGVKGRVVTEWADVYRIGVWPAHVFSGTSTFFLLSSRSVGSVILKGEVMLGRSGEDVATLTVMGRGMGWPGSSAM